MKKKFALTLSVMLVLAVAICTFAFTASAETGKGTITYVESDGTTTHTLKLEEGYETTYTSGESSIVYDITTDTVTLTKLNGGTITFDFADEFTVILVNDNALSKVTSSGADSTMIIDGEGTLTVEADGNSLLDANGNLKIMGGSVTVTASSDDDKYMIDVVGNLMINGARVVVEGASTQAILAKNGISIAGGAHVEATSTGNYGIFSNATTEADFTITGETTYVKSTAAANAILGTAAVEISGGTVVATSTSADTAVGTNGTLTISDGNVTATAENRPLKANTFNFNGGTVTATATSTVTEGVKYILQNNSAITILPTAKVSISATGTAVFGTHTVNDEGVIYADGFAWTVVDADAGTYTTTAKEFETMLASSLESDNKNLSVTYDELTLSTATVYDFDITWEKADYAFDYDAGIQGDWNPEDLDYGEPSGAGWTDDDLLVTVTNRSNAGVTVTLNIIDTDASDGLNVAADYYVVPLASAVNATEDTLPVAPFNLTISGTPSGAIDSVATVTINISAAANN